MVRNLTLASCLAVTLLSEPHAAQVDLTLMTVVREHTGPWFISGPTNGVRGSRSQGGGSLGVYILGDAQYGSFQFAASARASITDANAPLDSSAVGQYFNNDVLTFGGVSRGTPLKVNWSMFIDGFIAPSCTGEPNSSAVCAEARWNLESYLGGDPLFAEHERRMATDGGLRDVTQVDGIKGANPYGLLSSEATVVAGEPVDVYLNVQTKVSAGMPWQEPPGVVSTGSSQMDFLHGGIYWAGINSVTLLDGTPVDYSVTSESGTDYSGSLARPIPEPSTWALMLLGVITMSALRRRGFTPAPPSHP